MTKAPELNKFYEECESVVRERYYEMLGPGTGYSSEYLSILARKMVKSELEELAMTPHPRIVSESAIDDGIREIQDSTKCDASVRAINQLMDMGVIVECIERSENA